MRSFQPPRTRLCAFPTPRPGPRPRRRRASRGPRGRNRSPAIRLRRVAVDEGGGVSGSVGVLLYKRGSVGPCVCWKGVWGNRVAVGFAKHGSELPRVVSRGLMMSRYLNLRVFLCFPTRLSFFSSFTLPDVGECSQTSVVLLLGWSSWL